MHGQVDDLRDVHGYEEAAWMLGQGDQILELFQELSKCMRSRSYGLINKLYEYLSCVI